VDPALQLLSVGQRQALQRVGVEGLSYAETAVVLGIPAGSVMSRLPRARPAAGEPGLEERRDGPSDGAGKG
jgi:RNA polymerase sigma-70 factor (ECF subfamily)